MSFKLAKRSVIVFITVEWLFVFVSQVWMVYLWMVQLDFYRHSYLHVYVAIKKARSVLCTGTRTCRVPFFRVLLTIPVGYLLVFSRGGPRNGLCR